MDTPRALIEISDLVIRYGDRRVLNGISFDVRQGEILVIMGGSGSGKSTLMNALLGLIRPSSGSVRVLGVDIHNAPMREVYRVRKRIGVAFQGGALFSSMTLRENILLPLRENASLDENTMRIVARMKLEVAELSGFDDLYPAELSGGMTKRAALARAIVMDPEILFCDEPSAGLDPVVSSAIDDLLLRLRDAQGMTIVVVTHELESAFKIADRICVLDKGEILAIETVEAIRNSDNQRIQDLLNRRSEPRALNPEEYLDRLTAGPKAGRVRPDGS